jgi:hypothetical protein
LTRSKNTVESGMEQIKKLLNSKDVTFQQINDKIDVIYSRQQEVVIGKRNVNCLSCTGGQTEPVTNVVTGTDGKVYKGRG